METLLGTATICARTRWNRTGIRLDSTRQYRMAATGDWFDRKLSYGPEGGPAKSSFQRPFAWLRRRRHDPWFVLVGAVDARNATAFIIGRQLAAFSPSSSGELTCYANDVWLAYGNNSGSVTLKVWQRG